MRNITRGNFLKTLLAATSWPLMNSGMASASPQGSQSSWLGSGLGMLPVLTDAESRQVSPENPTGEKGMGGRAIPNPGDPNLPFSQNAARLGQGWKVSPFIKVEPRQTRTIMDVDGPGAISHIWMATERSWVGNGRACVLRFYWDHEETPSVEVPLTDFFAVGNDRFARVNSLAVVVNPLAALNCYWPMPFRRHAKITFTNDGDKQIPLVTYQIDYALTKLPADIGYFHAQWRRELVKRSYPLYTILDGVKGAGRYVGTFLAWTQLDEGWFGEGEVKFYIDGDTKFPTICGTGTEDYFGASYGFREIYTTAYTGNTLKQESLIEGHPPRPDTNGPPKWSLYRWHLMDPICFRRDFRATVQDLGWYTGHHELGYRPLGDDIASVAYWYQREPHAPFPKFPPLSARWPR